MKTAAALLWVLLASTASTAGAALPAKPPPKQKPTRATPAKPAQGSPQPTPFGEIGSDLPPSYLGYGSKLRLGPQRNGTLRGGCCHELKGGEVYCH